VTLRDRIGSVLAKAPVFDGHNDLPWELRRRVRGDLDRLDLRQDQAATGLHTDLPRLRAGGVGAQFWSIWSPDDAPAVDPVTAALEQLDLVRRMVARHPDALALASSADEVEAARAAGRLASLAGVEGGHQIGNSLGVLRMLYALGARYLTLTHLSNTDWADSATDAPRVGGLSPFGREVVRELNRLGMLVDLSHVAPSTMDGALDVSVAPAFFSHSSARALCDHPRNVPDAVLERVRDSGGVVMVTLVTGYLDEGCRAWMDALTAEESRVSASYERDDPAWYAARDAWIAANPSPPCGVEVVADHVEHVRTVAGVDAVGIGGDYDGMPTAPDGMPDVSGYPALLAALSERNWSDADLAKLTWGNAVRVLRETESVGRTVRASREPSTATYAELG
jgi:membrane dipeptidase